MISFLKGISEVVTKGSPRININGLCGSAGSFLLSQLQAVHQKETILVVTHSEERGREIFGDLSVFCGEGFRSKIALFEAPDVLPYTQLSPEPSLWAGRLNLLYELAHGSQKIVVAPISACLRFLPPKIFIANCARIVSIGEQIDRDELGLWLTEMGYASVPLVEDIGEFAIRGGIMDVSPPTLEEPVRIELEGDKIISMRTFNAETQRSKVEVRQMNLIPVRDVPFSPEACRIAAQAVSRLAGEHDLPAPDKRQILEYIKEKIAFAGIETFMPVFHGAVATLADYLPYDALVVIDEPMMVENAATKLIQSITDLALHTTSVERVIPPEKLYLNFAKWEGHLAAFQQVNFGDSNLILKRHCEEPFDSLSFAQGKLRDEAILDRHVALRAPRDDKLVYTVQTFSNAEFKQRMEGHLHKEDPLKPVVTILRERAEKGEKIIFATHTDVQAERLSGLFRWHGLSLTVLDSDLDLDTLRSGGFYIKIAKISGGFHWPSLDLSIITDEELFGSKLARRPKQRPPIEHFTSFSELAEGDYLVHELHGIGRYLGLKNLSIADVNNDFILLEYFGGDKLYLPVYRLNLLQRYIGPSDDPPFLDRLGGTRWKDVQKKAAADIIAIAKELLQIYAQREVSQGFPYPSSDISYEEFAAAFLYDETPDQERAIDDVVRDMEIERPMDRLICGDVGYGKTEIAMRAAFKAAMAGKQVAVLVPTTILAFQHYENFKTRFTNTPIRLEMLSRFRSSKEQKAVKEELARGSIDIVIGTHSLLGKGVVFKDLGLLIVDEEQHFGVHHKENIKKLRASVDCLTLTATPIPRTLHLSLTGIRDISVINTPPVDRLSISTEIVPFDDGIIRHAILEELSRGGQIFFVHNRVQTIRSMEEHIKKLVPEVSIGIAHGQMEERKLEDVMTRFVKKEIKLLLTTSIIESGLDIPSANTIIVNRADTFGLSQLYQIRGRIGRSNVRGYAYLLIPAEGKITQTAKRRLTVLKRFTELGSGFQIAMHDLEIRGSGNILGRAQSGHVAAIGYEMYTKLLAKEVAKLQGKPIEEEIDPELNLPVSAFLPDSYIGDPGTRLDTYRRLAGCDSLREVLDMVKEIEDRFGALPAEVVNLLAIMEIKVMAKELKVKQFSFDGRTYVCSLDKTNRLDLVAFTKFIETDKQHYLLRPPDKILYVTTGIEEAEDIIKGAKNFLSMLAGCASQISSKLKGEVMG